MVQSSMKSNTVDGVQLMRNFNLSGASSPVPHSWMKFSNVRSQCFHSLAAVVEFGSMPRRDGFKNFTILIK